MALTDSTLRNLRPREKPYSRSDGRGLHIEVMPGGKRVWRLRYRLAGKQEKVTLGEYPAAHGSYAAALGLDPRHFRSHNRLGELWLTEGKLVRARASLERAAALAPKDTRTQKALERLADAERAGS